MGTSPGDFAGACFIARAILRLGRRGQLRFLPVFKKNLSREFVDFLCRKHLMGRMMYDLPILPELERVLKIWLVEEFLPQTSQLPT
jgi:hypothetical protein